MNPMSTLADAATVLGAPLIGDGSLAFCRVVTDSRTIRPGDLFVALSGERYDGHDFVTAALAAGAVAAVVEPGRQWPPGTSRIEVGDPLAALGRLAADWRARCQPVVVAITGTNGKTSVKEMVGAILRRHAGAESVLATEGNLNNHIGVPLMLLRLEPRHRYAVLEMGMNHFGEIAYLTGLARPQVALVNNAGAGHLEYLGSVAGVAKAKGEIFSGLAAEGVAVINADDEFADYWRTLALGRQVIDFALDQRAAVGARAIDGDALTTRFTLTTPEGEAAVELRVPGRHNVANALAAAAVGLALGLPTEAIAAGLSDYAGVKGRLQPKRAASGALLIDDTYNANPNSMRAAIDVLAELTGPRWLVLGDMGEIGGEVEARHAEIGAYARERGIERLFTLGKQMSHAAAAFGEGASIHASREALLDALAAEPVPAASILVKGSRFMQMERVVAGLIDPAGCAGTKV
ncbi:UDP-N-acetylmuramoyl-tripeptide--D-alanyl-D-alanine ligase [Chitinimonas lacunae]|uniref:UDP-N-acetylmuramoyl-tripeptide--D-alanyl-D-alanine ligase n=1 Tax=Chitinimonas lacunae TaxID=1963018 RepID=A0ABV8MRK3_9NEIS